MFKIVLDEATSSDDDGFEHVQDQEESLWTSPFWRRRDRMGIGVKVVARAVDRRRERGLATLYGPGCDTCSISAAAPEKSGVYTGAGHY